MAVNRIKKIILTFVLTGISFGFAQEFTSEPAEPVIDGNPTAVNALQEISLDNVSSDVLVDALNAYKEQDWNSAVTLFKKLHSDTRAVTPESTYMLITAEVYAGLYRQAALDCDTFIRSYSSSFYLPHVIYQKGKCLSLTGDYEKSILTLSDFCHRYPKHELYSSALFWIGESFYSSYNFQSAVPVYSRVVQEFPDSPKIKDAKYRLDVITQREREDKLLYLLKQTGEDYLSSRENYEKLLRQYQVENTVGASQSNQIKTLREQNESLDDVLLKEKEKTAELEKRIRDYEDEQLEAVRHLQEQALEALKLLNEQENK